MPIVGALTFFTFLYIYSRVGPGIPFSVNSVQTNKTDLFTVSGEGKASAAPNLAIVSLGVQIQKGTVKEAQAEANKIINQLTDDLKSLGISEKDITTTNYSIYPEYSYQGSVKNLNGYNVNINVTVKVRDLDKVNEVIDKGTADGANTVGGLQFTLDDTLRKRLEDEARKEAIKEARSKAQSLAAAAGVTLGRIVNIQENFGAPTPIAFGIREVGVGGGGAPTKVEPGTAEISLTVSLSYELR